MAAKKKAKKKTAKKSSSKEIALPWQQQLAKHAQEGKAPKEKALTGDFISTKGGKFTIGGVKIGLDGKGRELDCVVIGWNFEKQYYDAPFQEGVKSSPACMALGYDEDELTPFDTCPNKQADLCTECELNEWGSGNGDGKACSDRRRLALVVAGENDKMELKLLDIPPTSLKNWKAYINGIEALGLHPMQCAVNISFDEDSTATQEPLMFEFVSEVTNEKALQTTAGLLDTASKLLEQAPDFSNYNAGGKSKKKASKKKVSKKKASKKKSKFS